MIRANTTCVANTENFHQGNIRVARFRAPVLLVRIEAHVLYMYKAQAEHRHPDDAYTTLPTLRSYPRGASNFQPTSRAGVTSGLKKCRRLRKMLACRDGLARSNGDRVARSQHRFSLTEHAMSTEFLVPVEGSS